MDKTSLLSEDQQQLSPINDYTKMRLFKIRLNSAENRQNIQCLHSCVVIIVVMSHAAIIKLSQTGGPEMAPSDKQLFNDRMYLFTVVFECTQFLFYTNCIYAIHLTGSAQHSRVWYGVVEYGR